MEDIEMQDIATEEFYAREEEWQLNGEEYKLSNERLNTMLEDVFGDLFMVEKMLPVLGNTYPVKEELKAMGARWDKDKKSWVIAESKHKEAQKLVKSYKKKKVELFPRSCSVCRGNGCEMCVVLENVN